ncbi:ADP-ribose glycohydrolase MACROD1 [Dirofilaria immitis]
MKAVLKRRLALLCYAFGPHVFYKICLFAGMQDVFMSRLGALSVVGRIAMVKKWDETITVAEFTKSNNPLARLIALDKGDITKLEIDAIVNAANSSLLGDIIHTVGPQVYSEVTEDQRNLLKSCYIESLKIAAAKNLRTIAFPCISTGVYGYPNDDACNVVVTSILAWLEENKNKIDRIIFVTFLDKDYDLYEKCLKERLA